MYDELGIGKNIDILIKQSSLCRELSIGTICKALILNGLGFTQRTLYMVESFFENKPVEQLLGLDVSASQLNDSVLGRALDDIHAYGTTKLFSELTPNICDALSLETRFAHMDSTDFHLDGVYNSDSPPALDSTVVHLTKGYSRDHRPDLNQVVLNLITDNQAGIPLHMEALSGNSSDNTAFRETIKNHIGQLQNITSFEYLVMDSAGYAKETLTNYSDKVKWISRVPETIKACKDAVRSDEKLEVLDEKHRYRTLASDYAGIEQRWLLIWSEEAYKREVKTLRKNYLKSSQNESKAFMSLCKEKFSCQDDAKKAFLDFEKKCRYISVELEGFNKKATYKKKGRPSKGRVPDGYAHEILGVASCPIDTYRAKLNEKGKYIVATNEMDCDKLTDIEVIKGYKGQSKVEQGFRFMKDPWFVASSFFVKKPERLESLVFIMTLCLAVYAALEYKLRQKLELEDQSIPDQLGKPTSKPTARWVFALFTGIHFLYGSQEKPVCLNIKPLHVKILGLLGDQYRKYYLLI